MSQKFRSRLFLLGALGTAACRTFALREEQVTVEPAPVTRVDVAGADTTYVLRTGGAALLARDRRLLWSRTTVDDAAHRFATLFGAPPPAIAIRLDSAVAPSDASDGAPDVSPAPLMTGTWDGLPLIAVRAAPPDPRRATLGEDPARALPEVAARAAEAWVRQLGAPADAWWLEVGAVRLVADPDARVPAIAQAAGAGDRTSLATLLAAPRPAVDAAAMAARSRRDDERGRPPTTATTTTAGTLSADGSFPDPLAVRLPSFRTPLGVAQSAALLLFLRDRDPAFLAALPARLRAGATLPELLPRSTALPHTVDAFDAEWREWLRARASWRTPQGVRKAGDR